MRIFLLPLLLLATSCGSSGRLSSELSSINIVDQNGFSETITDETRLQKYGSVDYRKPQTYQKVVRVYHSDPEGNNRAVITSYHPNGQIKQYLETQNSRAKGKYQEWHPNGQLKVEGELIGGPADLTEEAMAAWLFEGISRAWDQSGNLEATVRYEQGVLHGTSLHYHSSGRLWKEVPYSRGKIDGTIQVFLPSGQMLQKEEYRNGLRHGNTLRYWSNRQLAADEKYVEGKLQTGSYWDRSATPVSAITDGQGERALFGKKQLKELHQYEKGVQRGLVKVFDEKGKVNQSYHVADGLKDGEETLYYVSGQPKLSMHWTTGALNGEIKSWYPNGTLESKKELRRNKKHGLATAWYEDGSLMLIEEYESDHLIRGEYRRKGLQSVASRVANGAGTATLFDGKGNFAQKVLYEEGRPVK